MKKKKNPIICSHLFNRKERNYLPSFLFFSFPCVFCERMIVKKNIYFSHIFFSNQTSKNVKKYIFLIIQRDPKRSDEKNAMIIYYE